MKKLTRWISYIFLSIWAFSAAAEEHQSTDMIIMISPDTFQYNVQTAATNAFQQQASKQINATQIALREFNQMVSVLRKNQIKVLVLPSRKGVITPDAVFPNNWFSIHKVNGKEILVLYPMLAKDRRLERQVAAIQTALKKQHLSITKIIDLTHFEGTNRALEGTGSLVLDRKNKVAFVSLSPRTNPTVLNMFLKKMQYTPVIFHSYDPNGKLIYHTNVMLSIGSHFAVISADSITNSKERKKVLSKLEELHKDIIFITPQQMTNMAGNILELQATDGKTKILMSKTAYDAFTPEQRKKLKKYGDLIIVNIPVIEKLGGGSARCMVAEVFH